jgi:uncharacterized protein YlzI (FlbEa/FlbD family)
MPNLGIFGASNAKRMFLAAQENQTLKRDFRIFDFCIRGGGILDLCDKMSLKTVLNWSPTDTLVVQLGGNDIVIRSGEFKIRKDKNMHLPGKTGTPHDELTFRYEKLLEKLSPLPCKVIVITNHIRHFRCCPNHVVTGKFFAIQKSANDILNKVLNCFRIIKINSLLGLTKNHKSAFEVSKLTIDTVHFRKDVYEKVVNKLVELLI